MSTTALELDAAGRASGNETSRSPLRRVLHVDVSSRSGQALNPHYFWATWEYYLRLDCGHTAVRARCAFGGDPAPQELSPPLPQRVRCTQCPSVVIRRRARGLAADPEYDPVMAALVAALCRADPAAQDELLAWINRHGRYVADAAVRGHGYAAMALLLIEQYAADSTNPHAAAVRGTVNAFAQDPSESTRAAVRRQCQRLYGSQHRYGNWFAHRGIITAARITAPYPHNVRAALQAPTWDHTTRSGFYNQLGAIRRAYDEQRTAEWAAFVDGDADGVHHHSGAAELLISQANQLHDQSQPALGIQHRQIVMTMITTYQTAVGGTATQKP